VTKELSFMYKVRTGKVEAVTLAIQGVKGYLKVMIFHEIKKVYGGEVVYEGPLSNEMFIYVGKLFQKSIIKFDINLDRISESGIKVIIDDLPMLEEVLELLDEYLYWYGVSKEAYEDYVKGACLIPIISCIELSQIPSDMIKITRKIGNPCTISILTSEEFQRFLNFFPEKYKYLVSIIGKFIEKEDYISLQFTDRKSLLILYKILETPTAVRVFINSSSSSIFGSLKVSIEELEKMDVSGWIESEIEKIKDFIEELES
jgi:hypothetical protein